MSEFKTYCVVDQKEIPEARMAQRSVTCSPECAATLLKIRRARIDAKRCRYCHAPSTPEERKQFAQWRHDVGLVNPRGRPRKPSTEEAPQ